jgi:hypothetical protein
MSVTLLDIWRAARVRSVPFSGESAGYVVLALCEETRGTRSLELADVELVSDGSVRASIASTCSEAQGEKQLRSLLGRLLEVASSPGPSLWRAAGRSSPGGAAGLATELQKALIPFNRAAARRALLRLFRETERAVADGRLGDPPDQGSEQDLLRLSPPPAKVLESTSATPPPPPPPVKLSEQVQAQPPQAVAALPPVETACEQPEQLTRPETVVSRRRAGLSAPPPPLPATELARVSRTPRMGSMDVAVVSVPPELRVAARTPSPPPLPVSDDLTERVPEVSEFLECEALESEALEESPALVVGVHVADSEEAAEPVSDEELETRPLPLLAPPAPYEGVAAQPSEVSELLRGFQVQGGLAESELRRELKALAGVDLTPGAAVDVVPR